ncbi:MAG: DUF1385 domain-containing protein [Succiniclasticum sp.]|nr:DUF1385 domain-containing protein [Succiniclasticum sp.]MEE3478698.1 DUF1385 domain-containing protein [Succiniclasticum sp.]
MAKFNIGGQAVIEGVMMRGPKDVAVAVRKADGTIDVDVHPVNSIQDRHPILKKPLIRGVVVLIESLIMGMKALSYSAQVSGDEDEEMDDKDMALTIVVSVLLAVGLFIAIPTWSVRFLQHWTTNAVTLNLAEGVLRMAIFLAYIAAISSMKDIQRVFQYHGAEHKTIFTYEAGLPLTVENVRKFPRLHPRCGTNFLMIVMCISIFIFAFLGWPNLLERILSRVILMPVVAGVSYEIIRFAGRHNDNPWVHKLILPGLLLQKLTTREPADEMIEVAIASVKAVVPVDEKAVVTMQVPDSIALKAPVEAAEAAAEEPDAAETRKEAAEEPVRE